MAKQRFALTIALGWMIAFSIWAVGPIDASAQVADPGRHHEAHTGHHHDHGSGTVAGGAPMVRRPPHGGQMTVVGPLSFEAVYRPKETRLYCYAADHRPVSVRDVEGQISMTVRNSDKVFRFPLKYVAPRAGSTGHDCLAVPADDEWVCPMHRSVRLSDQGKCSICGMDLVRLGDLSHAEQSSSGSGCPHCG